MAEINDHFQRILGRQPRADELAYFNKFISSGDLQPYEVAQILEGLPENQAAMMRQQGQEYESLLAKSDTDIMNRAQDQIRSDFYQSGRPQSSGAMGAYSQSARDLAMSRQDQLASFYGRQLPGLREQYQGIGSTNLNRGYGMRDERRQREYQLEDFAMQKSLYDNYMAQSKKSSRKGALGRIGGSLIGASLGMAGGPAGMQLGAGIGAQAGGLFGGQ